MPRRYSLTNCMPETRLKPAVPYLGMSAARRERRTGARSGQPNDAGIVVNAINRRKEVRYSECP